MTDACIELIARMILNTMVGDKKKTWELYEQYQKEKHLHVTIKEILDWKERSA